MQGTHLSGFSGILLEMIQLDLRFAPLVPAADQLEAAVAAVIAEGKDVTYDMKPSRDDPTAVGTQEMAEAICAKM